MDVMLASRCHEYSDILTLAEAPPQPASTSIQSASVSHDRLSCEAMMGGGKTAEDKRRIQKNAYFQIRGISHETEAAVLLRLFLALKTPFTRAFSILSRSFQLRNW